MWLVIQLKGANTSVEWKHILSKCPDRNSAIQWAKENTLGYPPSQIFVESTEGPTERLALLDLLHQPAEESGADS